MTRTCAINLYFFYFQLTKPPVSIRALAILSTVAGDALTRHLGKIIPAMLHAVDKSESETAEEQVGLLSVLEPYNILCYRFISDLNIFILYVLTMLWNTVTSIYTDFIQKDTFLHGERETDW